VTVQRREADVPLCVDCDGTLTPTDLLHEAVILLTKKAPWKLFLLPLWLLRGKAYLKQRVAEEVEFDWGTLPLNAKVVDAIQAARNQGRTVVLATASHRKLAEPFARHLGLFDEVLCTDGQVNLSGAGKANALVQRYGERGFDYMGNSAVDLNVWSSARRAHVVAGSATLAQAARKVAPAVDHIDVRPAPLSSYLKALRLHQWLKNVLVFAPALAAHRLFSVDTMSATVMAFFAFGLCASAVYVINDLLDLEADRKHARKRHRPFASGQIPIWKGIALVPCLLVASAAFAWSLPSGFAAWLAFYFVCTLAYSVRLKQQVVVDVMVLAGLYTLRVIAGGAVIEIVPSFWLLALSMFLFLSLALVKRYSELRITLQRQAQRAAGRGYTTDDLPVLMSLGVSSGMAAALVLALYINDPATAAIYPSHWRLWLVPPILLYWVSRLWMKAHRDEVHDDPVVFAARDWQSLLVVALSAVVFALAGQPS
jgi:4-hydroxybenzoate polyprenyltransferase/phosphoserine phosphatase